MPKLNGTGPMGQGSRTGRGMGSCVCGCGRGFGRGMGFGWNAPQMTKKEETEWLTQKAELLEDELKAVREELVKINKSIATK